MRCDAPNNGCQKTAKTNPDEKPREWWPTGGVVGDWLPQADHSLFIFRILTHILSSQSPLGTLGLGLQRKSSSSCQIPLWILLLHFCQL